MERVLESMSEAVSESSKIIDRARESRDEDYLDGIIDDEAGVMETLAGTAFVVAQTQISGVVAGIRRICDQAKSDGYQLTTSNGKRDGILKVKSPLAGTSGFSRVEVIDAMANYFKHSDEWSVPWNRLERLAAKTSGVVLAVGGTENSTGNLRHGLKILGIDFDRLSDLHSEVSTWAEETIRAYETELRSRGLL